MILSPLVRLLAVTVAALGAASQAAAAPVPLVPKPGGVKALPRYESAKVTWNAVARTTPAIDFYEVSATSSSGVPSLCVTPDATATNCYPPLSNGIPWTIRVRAHSSRGYSAYSSAVSVKPTSAINCSGLYAYGNVSGCTLANRTITGVLSHLRAIGTKFNGANLTNVRLDSANMAGADLRGANLTNTYMVGTNLTGANLSSKPGKVTNISSAWFQRVDFTNANLRNYALTSQAFLPELQVALAVFNNTTCLDGSNSSSNGWETC